MQTRARSNARVAARRGWSPGQAHLGFSVFVELQRRAETCRGLCGRRDEKENNA